jgi:hypothetical protein
MGTAMTVRFFTGDDSGLMVLPVIGLDKSGGGYYLVLFKLECSYDII